MVAWVLRDIRSEFDAARIDCDLSYMPPESGERRRLVEQYYRTIDWANRDHILRVLSVYEEVLRRAESLSDDFWKKEHKKLLWCLEKDGYKWTQNRISFGHGVAGLDDIKAVAVTFDSKYMADQIQAMQAAIETNPWDAIGKAKDLIEITCKTILHERGKPVTGTPDVPTLSKLTLKELKLVPEGVAEAARGADVIKRLLSNLGTVGNGLAELRGLYGTGHGKYAESKGLTPRHARLAVGAAATLATFLFETHQATKS